MNIVDCCLLIKTIKWKQDSHTQMEMTLQYEIYYLLKHIIYFHFYKFILFHPLKKELTCFSEKNYYTGKCIEIIVKIIKLLKCYPEF